MYSNAVPKCDQSIARCESKSWDFVGSNLCWLYPVINVLERFLLDKTFCNTYRFLQPQHDGFRPAFELAEMTVDHHTGRHKGSRDYMC